MNNYQSQLPYRIGVGAMIINSKKQVFVAKRIKSKMESWQMPQGGVDQDEDLDAAIFREVYEEIGTDKISIIAKTKSWLKYDIPSKFISKVWQGKYRGQKQKWFLLNFQGNDNDFDLNLHVPEFSQWKWIEISDLVAIVVDFKKKLYREILSEFENSLLK